MLVPALRPDGRSDVNDSYATGSPAPMDPLVPVSVRCVLFDFDGPVCGLFRRHPAPEVARRLLAHLPAGIREHVLARAGLPVTDPQIVLRAVGELYPSSRLVSRLEGLLTQEEVRATASAEPAENATKLIRALSEAGIALAVTTNNSAEAVERYLERVGLTDAFGRHIHGRTHSPYNPTLLKPNPDCLSRALKSTGAVAEESLMIGDAPADFLAAERLGIRFLGYATRETKSEVLSGAGARKVIDRLPADLVELAAMADQLDSARRSF
ncbi:HAD family hydrolase [Streptomyces sp. NPDC087420]|uniref:HAD family hydrolase n=1 Tax=Streptomyces sp. NPDC087420 TaxID=3365785 RepID=UPI003836B407